ncbi:MAG: Fe(2+)-trafficking protein [Myxococcales bacterium]|nr:Fe(2+)-trafficking protein [Myxococcales bacterium]
MTNTTVSCVSCGNDGAAITSRVPFLGATKTQIQSSVCASCWTQWMAQQLKIINEYRLNLAEQRSRELLEGQVREFLKLGGGSEVATVGPDKARELGNL